MEAELVARFLAYLKAEGRTERYWRNMLDSSSGGLNEDTLANQPARQRG